MGRRCRPRQQQVLLLLIAVVLLLVLSLAPGASAAGGVATLLGREEQTEEAEAGEAEGSVLSSTIEAIRDGVEDLQESVRASSTRLFGPFSLWWDPINSIKLKIKNRCKRPAPMCGRA